MAMEGIQAGNGNSREINGDPAALVTERAVEELRRGRAIRLADGDASLLLAAVETLEASVFERMMSLQQGTPRLLVTAERARVLRPGPAFEGPASIPVGRDTGLELLRSWAGLKSAWDAASRPRIQAVDRRLPVAAAFRLAKSGRLLPALLAVRAPDDPGAGVVTVRVGGLDRLPGDELTLVSRAEVPLVDAVDCEIGLFRQQNNFGEHLAILIGRPELDGPVPVRLHSACLTGDVLGSLRCDCGDQLKRAVRQMASLGGGVLLYLDQEGRGIGLANKLRAYALQDAGLDTLDADQHLGFLADERSYGVAASMLRELGIGRVRLLTNNPEKISALTGHGIEVAGRLPLVATVNAYNRRYLEAKLDRAGHFAD